MSDLPSSRNGMNDGHLDLLALDAARAGEELGAAARDHLASCAACRAQVEELADLAGRFATPTIAVPAVVDAAIIAAGRRRRSWRPALAAAAVVLVAVGAFLYGRPDTPVEPMDLDANRSVDIVDAYLLAQRIEGGERLSPRWDFNGDGRVDRADVDLIARTSVRLGG